MISVALGGEAAGEVCTQNNADPKDRSDWPDQHEWLWRTGEKFVKLIVPFLQGAGAEA